MGSEETVFADAARLSAPEVRAAYLDRACGDDAALRRSVEQLLAAHDRARGVLESPVTCPPPPVATPPSESPGATVGGRYRLLERIGEGGMGVVFMAEQQHPVRRRVALKVIRPGLDTAQVIARFEAERQALALMDHPNIAKVLDAGATDAGRPFFVMELVRGIPITEYCDQHHLPPRERLALFVHVCQAVQHAHTKGIIHRDLKPTNVLVTVADDGRPVPKVIDFGIAKATTGQQLTDRTLFTEFRQLVGTPLYMSPEQAEQSAVMDVDTRSDVYSLGVLLYELLTGTTPFDKKRLAGAAFEEVRRILREEEPPRPSTRLSTLGETLPSVSAVRKTDPRRLGQLVRGELDWIVMRALEKDRARRYETASGMARDVERYLADEPVEACPPSRTYRLRTFARRHRVGLATAASFATVLVLATAVSVWQAVRATRAKNAAVAAEATAVAEKARADEGRQRYAAMGQFLTRSVLGQADDAGGDALTLSEALDRASETVGEDLKDHPQVEAALRLDLSGIYRHRGELQKALKNAEVAVRLFRQVKGPEFVGTIVAMARLAAAYDEVGEYAKAEPVWTETLAGYRKLRDTSQNTEDLDEDVVGYLMRGDRAAEAEQLLLELIGSDLQAEHDVPENVLGQVANLGRLWFEQGRYVEAEPLLLRVLKQASARGNEATGQTVYAKRVLAAVYTAQRRFAEAEPLYRDALATSSEGFGPRHRTTIDIQMGLGVMLLEAGELDEATETLLDTWNVAKEELTERHDVTFTVGHNLAVAYARAGRHDEAEATYKEVLEAQRSVLGDKHDETLLTFDNLVKFYTNLERYADAEALYRDAIARRVAQVGPNHQESGFLFGAGRYAAKQGKWREAESAYREALAIRREKNRGALDMNVIEVLQMLQEALTEQGKHAEAVEVLEEISSRTLVGRPPGHPDAVAAVAALEAAKARARATTGPTSRPASVAAKPSTRPRH